MNRIKIILNAMTQLLGAFLCVTLNANESTSGWAYRTRGEKDWPYIWINRIFFWQKDHCAKAKANEIIDCRRLLEANGIFAVDPAEVADTPKLLDAITDVVIEKAAQVKIQQSFDAQEYFDSLDDMARRSVVEFGANLPTYEQRVAVKRLAETWLGRDAKARSGHGMTE